MRGTDQIKYLQSLGIPLWVPRDFNWSEPAIAVQAAAEDAHDPGKGEDESGSQQIRLSDDIASMNWDELHQAVLGCTACDLHMERTQAVFGTGSCSASLMVIGEAPGADEDIQGEPFVGRAGQLLDQMLQAIGHPRSSVYIANIVKCRPPNNRNPQPEEALHCAPYLHRQISLVQPDVILAVGKVAAQNLLQSDLPIGKMRGNQYRYAAMDIPVIVTYHPAYLLRSPKEKAKSWQDLKLVRSYLE